MSPTPDEEAAERRGNFVSEWFGHRLHPTVTETPQSLTDQQNKRCPFLSAALHATVECVKSDASKGICTISSSSNGPRQDWLVCPFRALDRGLLDHAARRLFPVETGTLLVVPAPTLAADTVKSSILATLRAGGRALVFLQAKLGGEVALSATARSPEVSFDTTLVEIVEWDGALDIGKYGILEVQTMDFHGTYKYAVKNLTDALRLHGDQFHAVVRANEGRWISERIEGPNIANVFKRTFYQVMLKFQIGAHPSSAGCVLALPAAVWDSWQRHLGGPEPMPRSDGTLQLSRPDSVPGDHVPGWILVFDLDSQSASTPNPVAVQKTIATDADSVAHFAVKVAPEVAIAEGGAAGFVTTTIRRRLAVWWPALAAPPSARTRNRRGDRRA